MFKNFFRSMFFCGFFLLFLNFVFAATPNEIFKEYACSSHNINGTCYNISDSQKCEFDKYLSSHELSEDAVNTAISKIDEAKEIISDAGVNSVSLLPNNVKADVVSLAKEAGNAVGVDTVFDVNSKNIIFKDDYGNVLEGFKYNNDSLAFKPLFIIFSSVFGLLAIIFKMKNDFDKESN